ncbi:MAG: AMP-dependent synthetase [Candidatus Dactylopiibacterium carminicum]|uniref:Long-chain-fatty-acid--CoA ligase n=1 Tax=Candidatus Dactylopiibacterium carminicum TaxID=857335 RepID=A0A272EWT2_9RHOO|nr:AMP-binding protein [Candidatus Dactylopiibacterium carminicum]KAF7600037.1 AMP-dependent synthetase [Candidatus Dactylopiibacterium carminicum]PAS94573.1 MAG: AMP-dependent synthetase [Candidatus Dactylopiibacterium carminicum]PAS97612.1 MAG: AMP-dependent synthetase [Candidatus Dactylopiibacterium carminicum]PAT00041.1 MAG: hypothetical protein BSR46_04695 [Candidatus Dactylopiibacterium carminicum]
MSAPDLLPLLPEAAPETVCAIHRGRAITRRELLAQVAALATRLPAGRPLLNLCNDRYLFAIGLLAAISRGATSLLPNATAPENIAALHADWPELLCLSDDADAPFGLPWLQVRTEALPVDAPAPLPVIPATQRVACVFTSGSTGRPQPHAKHFGPLFRNARTGAQRLWQTAGGACAVLGTVPFQHMYGLESTVLLPLFGGGILCGERPFFPADVATALDALPAPRLLVTTPFHLRTLLDAGLPMPKLGALLSATAPLPAELAIRAEQALAAPMLEIYGSTETGQVATRAPAQETDWLPFAGIHLEQEGDFTFASGAHVEGRIALGDLIERLPDARFRLVGRHADMINIAGKRSSLAYLNHILCAIPGVRDGAFCLPGNDADALAPQRLAAFVVAPGMKAEAIRTALRQRVDAVFLPRPVVLLDALPRNATGKLTATALAGLISAHIEDAG